MQSALKPSLTVIRTVLITAMFALGACSFTPPSRAPGTTRPEITVLPEITTGATTTPLESSAVATSPWEYIALARDSVGDEKTGYLLDAVEGFLDLGQSSTARTVLDQLDNQPLQGRLFIRRQLLLARSHFLEQQYTEVEAILKPLAAVQGLVAEDAEQIMLLRARAFSASGQYRPALVLLIAREPLLPDTDAIARNQDTIWQVLAQVEPTELNALTTDRTNPTLTQWADLAIVSSRLGWNVHASRQALTAWQQQHPSHPASRVLIPRLLYNLGSSVTEYRKVALLLPLTSGFGAAAQAVYDGLTMMYEADNNPNKPEIMLYDTGENPELIGFYYQAAVRDGAQLVLGPLGKVAVDSLVATTELTVPTLLLGNTEGAFAGRANTFEFGLSPEDEARQLARHAAREGYRVAAALYPEADWGIRQLDAFMDEWRNLGGTLTESRAYQLNAPDHSQTIKLLLNLDESETRHRQLKRITGKELEFVPKRREDIDFVFMIARSDQGRLLKPQINFYKGQNLPVYAISQVYSGRDEQVKDLDLEGVIFADMPWLLLDSGISRAIHEQFPQASRYANQPLDRLFALGIDTYQLLFRLEAMKTNPLLKYSGVTGLLSLNANGSVARQLAWAEFRKGEPQPLRRDNGFGAGLAD
ncbi:MAG: penicillin-binding protein activator [marine bacterium B5-7]|nr:MAG: penicillin-binding protein activator [marine bacterium B5-7]